MTKELFIKSIEKAREQYSIDMKNSSKFDDSYNNDLLYATIINLLIFDVVFFNRKDATEVVGNYIFHNTKESTSSIYDKIHYSIDINKK